MKLFCEKVYDRKINGSTTDYTSPDFDELLATPDKYLCFVRTAQGGGTSPTMTIVLQRSNDRLIWDTKATFFSGTSVSTTAIGTHFASDTGSAVGGAYGRLSIALAGTTPSAHLQIFLCGRGQPAGQQRLGRRPL